MIFYFTHNGTMQLGCQLDYQTISLDCCKAGSVMGHGLDLAFSMVSPMIFGFFMGLYLDQVFQTKPWLMLGLTFLGVATGFWSLIKQVYGMQIPPEDKQASASDNHSDS